MKKILIAMACLGLVFALGAPDASAMGLGFGFTSGSGDADISIAGSQSTTHDVDASVAGLVLDTNLSMDRSFNYRLTIGKASMKIDDLNLDMDGFGMAHDFGFGIVKNDNFRLWMGPELRLAWMDGTSTDALQTEYDVFSFGFGPVLGANFNIGPTVTISVTGAYVMQTTNGEVYNTLLGWDDYEADDEIFSIGLGLIFRMNEY